MPALLTLMVGPSGCGKSSFLRAPAHAYLRREYDIKSRYVLSSDDFREDLVGDVLNQSKNEAVFKALHAIAKTRLSHGLPTVIDATHLKRQDRRNAALLMGKDWPVRYIVLYWDLEKRKFLCGGTWRDKVPHIFEKHENLYQSQLHNILAGDKLENVTVVDLREEWNRISLSV